MRKTPRWFDDEVERHAKLVLSEEETQEQAVVSLRMLLRDDHREFGNAILDDYSAPKLATAVAVLRSRRAAELRAELAKARAEAQPEVEATAVPPATRPAPAPQAAPRPAPASAPQAPPVRSHAPAQDRPALTSVPALMSTPTEENPPPQDGRIASMERELATLVPPSDPEWDLHRTLFPDFPFRSLKVTPDRYEQVHKMTRHQLEMARKILHAKTGNAIKGAEDERRRFDALYDKVHPLMSGDDTVADAERRLAAQLHPSTQ